METIALSTFGCGQKHDGLTVQMRFTSASTPTLIYSGPYALVPGLASNRSATSFWIVTNCPVQVG